MLETESNLSERINVFGGLISRLDTVEERIVEHEDISILIYRTEKHRTKKTETNQVISKNCEIITRSITHTYIHIHMCVCMYKMIITEGKDRTENNT